MPLLLFTVATFARHKWDRPIRWSAAVTLLAAVSLHTFLIAGGILFIHLLELAFRWRRLDRTARKGQVAAISLCAFGTLLLALILWPVGATRGQRVSTEEPPLRNCDAIH